MQETIEETADEYCAKILIVMGMYGKLRFNELYRTLKKCGVKISKPTLIEHLNHLTKNELIQRNQKEKQKVSYELNLKELRQLQKIKKINQEILKDQKEFKSMTLNQQTTFTTILLDMSELVNLRLRILNILEPERKLQNYYISNLIRAVYNQYTTWLLDSCKESKDNTRKILNFIDEKIKMQISTVQSVNKSP